MTATIIMPLYGHSEFADLAIRSLIKHSRDQMNLIIIVEPVNTARDDQWLEKLPALWPWRLKIISNPKRLGYYVSVNQGVLACETDAAIIFTSDQFAAPGWEAELLRYLAPRRFVTGRLVESGVRLIADDNLFRNFGRSPKEFREREFIEFCRDYVPRQKIDIPRHYLPMAFYKKDFIEAGLFVEGKEADDSKYREDFFFLMRCYDKGYELVEVQKPISYHFQGGSRKGRYRMALLNWFYPLGLKRVHRMLTGYVSIYDALVKHGAKERMEQTLSSLNQ